MTPTQFPKWMADVTLDETIADTIEALKNGRAANDGYDLYPTHEFANASFRRTRPTTSSAPFETASAATPMSLFDAAVEVAWCAVLRRQPRFAQSRDYRRRQNPGGH